MQSPNKRLHPTACLLAFLFIASCAVNSTYNRYNWDKIEKAAAGEESVSGAELSNVEKVVYYDKNYPASWVYYPEELAKFLKGKNFTQVNAKELEVWMKSRIEKGEVAGTVCVLAMGVVPVEIVTPADRNCLLYKYLRDGGRVVWVGDYPLLHIGYPGGYYKTYDTNLGWDILQIWGYRVEPTAEAPLATITSEGKEWGMSLPEKVHTPVSTINVSKVFSDVDPTMCGSWLKNIAPSHPYSGFIRYRATLYDGRDRRMNEDVYRLATYLLKK